MPPSPVRIASANSMLSPKSKPFTASGLYCSGGHSRQRIVCIRAFVRISARYCHIIKESPKLYTTKAVFSVSKTPTERAQPLTGIYNVTNAVYALV